MFTVLVIIGLGMSVYGILEHGLILGKYAIFFISAIVRSRPH